MLMRYFSIIYLLLISLNAKSQNVYKTPSGAKYHLATCRMVKNTSQEITLNQAEAMGLGACKICRPPIISGSNAFLEKKAKGESSTVRCKGMTKAGTRCKHMTRIANGYCFQHSP